ncbi:hypothetical protein ABZ894_06780 [Nocardia beijingensis]|uniref:hypothetical protein n=1 Tax=Nocardia beijingensis TaxID=95162 RepID=UPI0033FC489B
MFFLDSPVVVAVVVRPTGEALPTRREVLVTVFPHLVMDIAMAVMPVAALAPGEFAAAYDCVPAPPMPDSVNSTGSRG